MNITHQQAERNGRFVVLDEGKEAGFLKYEVMENGNLKATGTLVHEDYRPKKYGINLFDALIEYAKQSDKKIFPVCPFVVRMFQKNPELSFLLDPDYVETN